MGGVVAVKDYIISLVGGCIIGFAGTLVFNLLINFFPSLKPSSISAVALILNMENYGMVHYFLIAYLCILAPVAEEYLFRGLLWNFLDQAFSKNVAYLLTTSLFCLAHMEILHIVSILPLSLFFGWLRYRTGNIYLPILAHVVNNVLATIIFIY